MATGTIPQLSFLFSIAGLSVTLSGFSGLVARFFDYFAVYVGVRNGQATISALLNGCVNTACRDTNLWRATVKVT